MAVLWACFALPILCLFNLSLMTYIRAVHILWTPLYFKHLCIIRTSLHSIDTFPYCGHLSFMNAICKLWTPLHYECNMHTMDTSPYCGHLPLWMQYAYYGYLFILWTRLHYEHNMHTTDTSAFFISHTMDTFSYKSLLHTPLHKLWTPLHTKETYAQCGPLRILQTPLHTAVYTYEYMYYGHLCII